MPFPEGKLVYDYVFEPAKMKWGAWLDRLDPKAVASSDAEYTSIIVPTGEGLRAVREGQTSWGGIIGHSDTAVDCKPFANML